MSIIAPVKPYFKYSLELLKVSPEVAYYCKFFAVTKGLDLVRKDQGDHNDSKAFLMNELADLEKLKNSIEGSKEDHKYTVENFILSVFAKTDKDERTVEKITKQNAMDFKRCADFIALLTLFGELEEEWKEREKYCKYKAGTILKAIKSGQEPPRGNPFV